MRQRDQKVDLDQQEGKCLYCGTHCIFKGVEYDAFGRKIFGWYCPNCESETPVVVYFKRETNADI